jgi:hypothetical protein
MTIPFENVHSGPAVYTTKVSRKNRSEEKTTRGLEAFLDGPVKEKSLSKQGCFIIGELERFHEGKTSYPSFSNCLRDILKFYNAETLLEVFRVDFGFTCGVPSDANKVFDSICQSFEQFLVNFI